MTRNNFIDWNGSGSLDPQDLVTGVGMDVAQARQSLFSEDEVTFIKEKVGEYTKKSLSYIHIQMHKVDLRKTRFKSKQEYLYDLLLGILELEYSNDDSQKIVQSVLDSYAQKFVKL